jgi:hypothetical protein
MLPPGTMYLTQFVQKLNSNKKTIVYKCLTLLVLVVAYLDHLQGDVKGKSNG